VLTTGCKSVLTDSRFDVCQVGSRGVAAVIFIVEANMLVYLRCCYAAICQCDVGRRWPHTSCVDCFLLPSSLTFRRFVGCPAVERGGSLSVVHGYCNLRPRLIAHRQRLTQAPHPVLHRPGPRSKLRTGLGSCRFSGAARHPASQTASARPS
jgi:hypothetical protein